MAVAAATEVLWLSRREIPWAEIVRALWLHAEKAPWVALAYFDCQITVVGQEKGVALNSFDGLPLWIRVLNAIESCGEYLRQTVWPTGLAPFYAHPYMIPPYITAHHFTTEFLVKTAVYSVLLLGITIFAAVSFFRRSYLAVGWLWFLGAVVPVVGIIQVGTQARADRYTYLPMIGVYVMVAWLLKEAADRWPSSRPVLAAGSVVVLVAMSAASFRQVGLWINSYALFKDASGIKDEDYFGYIDSDQKKPVDLAKAFRVADMADRTKDNYFAFNHIGIAYDKDGKDLMRTDPKAGQDAFDRSAAAFAATLGIKADYDFGNNNLGVYFARPGKAHDAQSAEKYFRKAITVNSRYADAYNNLGIVLAEQGRALRAEGKFDEALAKLEDAAKQHAAGLTVRYDRASDHNNLCGVFLTMGEVHKDEAEKARAAGNSAKAAEEGRLQAAALDAALKEDGVALECDRNFIGAWQTRAEILSTQDKPDEMVPCYERIAEIDPLIEGMRAINNLLALYEKKKDVDKELACLDKAAAQFSKAIAGRQPSEEFIRMPFFLANSYAMLKQPEKAVHWLDLAGEYVHALMGKRPNSQEAATTWVQIAVKYRDLNQPDKAIAWLNEILAVNATLPPIVNLRAEIYEAKGDHIRAKGGLRATIEAGHPTLPALRRN